MLLLTKEEEMVYLGSYCRDRCRGGFQARLWRQKAEKVVVVFWAATDTSPQKERPEHGWKRRNTSDHQVRITAELSSRNRNLETNLLLCLDRSRRLSDGGRLSMRTSWERRNSRIHRNWRVYSLQSVHGYRIGFVNNLENTKFLNSFKNFVWTSVERR